MSDIAPFIGGFGAIYVFAYLWERLVFQRIFDDPVKGKVGSVVASWLTVGTLLTLLNRSGVGLMGYLATLIAALTLGAFAYHRGLRLREEIADERQQEVTATFE